MRRDILFKKNKVAKVIELVFRNKFSWLEQIFDIELMNLYIFTFDSRTRILNLREYNYL